jgi:hypothetical protein
MIELGSFLEGNIRGLIFQEVLRNPQNTLEKSVFRPGFKRTISRIQAWIVSVIASSA